MMLGDLLSQRRVAILKRWFDLILETYPPDTARFLRNQKDRFANPVGYTILRGIEALFEELLQGMDSEKVSPFLDDIIRIRAVQDFSPSKAIAFVFLLKRAVRDELRREIRGDEISDELVKFDSKVDKLALLAFDIYMRCREKIYEIRVNEVKNRTFRLLERANLICGISEAGT